MKINILSLILIFLLSISLGYSQNGIMDNFDNNVSDPAWKYNLNCATCYTGTETNSELQVVTSNVGGAYENFEYSFAAIDITANPIVKINVKNTGEAFNLRVDLEDIDLKVTNATPNVKAIAVNASYVQYTFDFTGLFNQTTPDVATVNPAQITKVVFFVNPGGPPFTNTIYFDNLIVGSPPAPTAGFSESLSTACTGTPITFTNTSTSNGISSYAWSFGDGATPATATTFGPHTVTWSSAGEKTVTLTVTGPGGSNISTSTLTLNGMPAAAGTITGTAIVCSGNSASYSIPAVTNATGYAWTLPTGAVITTGNNTNNATVSFASEGGVITVTPLNSTCGNGTTSPNYSVTVNPSVTAAVNISTASTSICSGTSATFTAAPTNQGTIPVYQWKVNGTNVGSNSTSFTSNTLNNDDEVTVVMTSNAACVSNSPVTSAPIVMSVSATGTPSVSINTLTPSICTGTYVSIAAVPINGGSDPIYVWKKNNIVIAEEVNDTLIAAIVSNQDVFTVEMTANGCATGSTTAISNAITITVNPRNMVTLSAVTPMDTVCTGSTVSFTTVAVNEGTSPSYLWTVNGITQGTNSSSFNTSTLNHLDTVTVEMTSNSPLTCLTNNPASSSIIMNVVSSMTSAVQISSSATTTCSGSPVTFTATPIRNGGTNPTYQWKVGGVVDASSTTSTFTRSFSSDATVTCVMSSDISCAQASTSNAIQITITTTVTPVVTITTPSTAICSGSPATFTATTTNGGNPSYEWRINGIDQAAALSTFTSTSLVSGDRITCRLTTDLSCASPLTALSNELIMTVNPIVTPSVSISATPSSTICRQTEVEFTATPANGGASPSYEWKVNGISTGETGSTFTSSSLLDTDAVTCEMVSNHPCASTTNAVVSNSLVMDVSPVLTASVRISASISPICPGTPVTFTAVPTNGGTPAYQWKLNGGNVGTNSVSYVHPGLSENDEITCVMTSNAACLAGTTATSNLLKVKPAINATISIAASENPICTGMGVTFTSTVSGEGTNPTYQWKKDNVILSGETNTTYSASSIANGASITCVLSSNATCAVGSPVTSSPVVITVTPTPVIGVTIATPTNPACAEETVTFTASPAFGGPTPSYQWQVGGQNVGTNSPTFSSSTLSNGNTVTCIMTSSQACAGPPVTSNSINMVVKNPPSIADAGWDQYVTTASATLEANPPASGTGTWTKTGSATISSPASLTSDVGSLSLGPNVFTWTVANAPCTSTSDQVIINYGNAPTAKAITGPVYVATNSSGIKYSIPASTGSSYVWTVVGATYAGNGTNEITVAFGSADVFISVTEINNYGDYTNDLDVSVGDAPSVPTIVGDLFVAASSTFTYTVSPSSSNSTYTWTVTGATPATGTGTSIQVNFTSTNAVISVKETNNYGNNTNTINVTVGSNPVTPVIIGRDSVMTNSTNVTYSITAHSSSTYTWQVIDATIVSGQGTNTVTVNFSTTDATIFVTEETPSGPADAFLSVKVGNAPQVTLIDGPSDAQTGTTTHMYIAESSDDSHSTFYWTFPNGTDIISGAGTNTVIVAYPPGTLSGTITVVQDNGFGTSTLSKNVNIGPTGLWTRSNNSLMYTLFPNPFSEQVNVTFNTPIPCAISLTITNMKGELVYYSNEYRTNEKIVLGEQLSSGLYAVKAVTDQGTQVIKINKE